MVTIHVKNDAPQPSAFAVGAADRHQKKLVDLIPSSERIQSGQDKQAAPIGKIRQLERTKAYP